MPVYLGIDPGKSGAIVALGTHPTTAVFCTCKQTERDLWAFIRDQVMGTNGNAFCVIEKVSAMPKQGVTSMFNFGMSYGFLRGIVVANQIPFHAVAPTAWQKAYGLIRKKKETDTQKKNRHKERAQELFPTTRVTHALADALLIAHYCREQFHKPISLDGLI